MSKFNNIFLKVLTPFIQITKYVHLFFYHHNFAGLPEPPVDLRLAQRTSDKIILTWLPVTLSQDGYSNGYKVSGYKVYVNDIFCLEIASACVDNAEISMERLRNLGRRHDFSRMRFVVRTLSVLGESVNSNVVDVGWDESEELKGPNAKEEGKEENRTSAKENTKVKKLENEFAQLEGTRNSNHLESDLRSIPSSSEASKSETTSLDHVADENDVGENLGKAESSTDSPSEQHSEPGESSFGSKEDGLNSVDEDAVETSLRLDTEEEGGMSTTADGPAMIVRRQPIVTRYEELETESESPSTESKTQDTEDELIERFEQLEVGVEIGSCGF